MNIETIGRWAFIAGVIIALLAGIAAAVGGAMGGYVPLLMLILGVIVGLTTVTEKETTPFLVAAIALLVANGGGAFLLVDGVLPGVGTGIDTILVTLAPFVAPAAIIMAVKAIYNIGRTR
ncbi:hypothetical protein KAI23_00400 [Candidatus Bathyarchaeota archaeon]|nr:hypothetical protein [Candidatus Bathyarchaeota archaeon]